MIQRLAIKLIEFYQGAVSSLMKPRCRFMPSCSQYWKEAIAARGLVLGVVLGVWRLLRCQPFCRAGWDPVPLVRNPHPNLLRQAQDPSPLKGRGEL